MDEQAIRELRDIFKQNGFDTIGGRPIDDLTDEEVEAAAGRIFALVSEAGRKFGEAVTRAVVHITEAFAPLARNPAVRAEIERRQAQQ